MKKTPKQATTVYLEVWEHENLSGLAHREKTTMTALISEALGMLIDSNGNRNEPARADKHRNDHGGGIDGMKYRATSNGVL